jgi:serine/threonine-protein kinase
VLVTRRGGIKLIDFGIARSGAPDAIDSGLRRFGTIRYMAPEQLRGRSVDRRADVWAAGAILHTLLCGRTPHDGSRTRVVQRVRGGEPPLIVTAPVLFTDVPPEVVLVTRRALERDPQKRFETALHFRDALESAATAAGLDASTYSLEAFFAADMAERLAGHARRVQAARPWWSRGTRVGWIRRRLPASGTQLAQACTNRLPDMDDESPSARADAEYPLRFGGE